MLNRIVLKEKEQIATLKVIDELRRADIQPEMEAIEKSLASANTRKVTLDLDNLQVLSEDTHELLGLIIRHVRLKNIPISITGSSQLDPGILLALSEGRPQIIEQPKPEKEAFSIKPKYFSRFETPFFSSDNDSPVFKRVIPDNYNPEKHDVAKHFLNDKSKDFDIVLPKDFSNQYSVFFRLGWLLFAIFTVTALILMYYLWPDYQSGKIQKVFLLDNKKQFSLNKELTENIAVAEPKMTSLIIAVKSGEKGPVEHLLATGAELELKDKKGYTAFMHAVKSQNVKLVKLLAERGAMVDLTDEFGDTPLIWAASMKDKAIVKLLLEHGADPDKGDFTPLMWAAFHGDLQMLNLFLKSSANLNARTQAGWTALMWAAEKGNTQAMWELLKSGARVNMQNKSGKTALIIATQRGNLGSIGLLLKKGGDPSVVDFDKKTSLDYARDSQRQDFIQLMEKEVGLP
ncbi:MAG: ankyrin repeat domain-containing protein [SAR324 cluster bacterium]|nr:ankyrin repeat domain-containing protein [SAR324 cluster bacterium]